MYELIRTNSEDNNFQELVRELDKDLAIRDGADHAFYAQYNKLDKIKHVLVLFKNKKAIACGALKKYDNSSAEIKRMFVILEERNKGAATRILSALEKWSEELGYENCILETGLKQPEAIALYTKNNYQKIENYGPYKNVTQSVCFKKKL